MNSTQYSMHLVHQIVSFPIIYCPLLLFSKPTLSFFLFCSKTNSISVLESGSCPSFKMEWRVQFQFGNVFLESTWIMEFVHFRVVILPLPKLLTTLSWGVPKSTHIDFVTPQRLTIWRMAKSTHGTSLGSAINNLGSGKITPLILFYLARISSMSKINLMSYHYTWFWNTFIFQKMAEIAIDPALQSYFFKINVFKKWIWQMISICSMYLYAQYSQSKMLTAPKKGYWKYTYGAWCSILGLIRIIRTVHYF